MNVHLFNGDPLAIYLNDHLAGSTAAVELARRAAANNATNAYGEALRELADEMAGDRAALEDLMRRFDIRRDRVKVVAGWGAEKAGRLKLNGRILGYSPLSRLEEFELLLLGVNGKLSMWRALGAGRGGDVRVREDELEVLETRAESQRHRLEQLCCRAAAEAFDAVPAGR